MDENEFQIEILKNDNPKKLPLKFRVIANFLGIQLNVTLRQVDGILRNSSLNSKVYMKNTGGAVEQVETEKLV
jgi:hypothetical protein